MSRDIDDAIQEAWGEHLADDTKPSSNTEMDNRYEALVTGFNAALRWVGKQAEQ